MRTNRLAPALAMLAVVALVSCGLLATRIGDIKANPGKYEGKRVTISGTVTASANVLFVKGYWVEDGTGKILVVPKGAVPAEGAKVTTSGKVRQYLAVGSSSTLVLNEE
jgi:hypothetical protein